MFGGGVVGVLQKTVMSHLLCDIIATVLDDVIVVEETDMRILDIKGHKLH